MLGRTAAFLCSLSLLLPAFLAGPAWAAPVAEAADRLSEPRFESVGLGTNAQGVVSAVAQDRAGFIWIGTGAGLMRYDGYSFRLQKREGQAAAAQSLGFIRTLLAAKDGRLWIGTESDGLASYDPTNEKVTLYRSEDGSGGEPAGAAVAHVKARPPAPTIRALVEDGEGALWVGSTGGGLDRFDIRSASFTHHHHAGIDSLPDDRVQSLLVDRQGTLWVGTWSGLARRLKGSERFEPVFSSPGTPGLAGKIVLRLFEASDGGIWAGTQQGDLAQIDPRSGQGRLIAQASGPGVSGRGAVYSFAEAPGAQLWVGRAAGIELRAVDDGRLLRHLHHDPRRPASLAGNEVRALLLDRAGWIWVGGYGVGLQRHNPANRSIAVLGPTAVPGDPLEEASLRAVLALDNGEIWLGSNAAGVLVMDASLRLQASFKPQPPGVPLQALAGSRIGALAQMGDGTVWVGADTGLYQFDRQRRQLRSLQAGNGLIRRLHAGRDGTLWIGTQDGLYRLVPGGTVPERLRQQDQRPLGGDINAIVEAADRSLWIGTEKGLYRVDPGTSAPRLVTMREGAGLNNPSVVGLLIDSRQQLWVDTAVAGLHRLSQWDGKEAAFERVSEHFGVVGRPFGANLLEDERGRIWTQQFVYDPARQRFDELTGADGVDIGTGWFRSYAKTADGRLLFGGSKGLLVVRPERFESWAYAPPLVVSALRVDGRPQPAGQVLRGLHLTPEQRSFSVEFAALDYSEPGRSRYAYRLDGFDRDWINGAADFRSAAYGNLPPGHYVLHARGSNRSGRWSEQELALDITIEPAWWQSWWGRALQLAAAALLLWGLVWLRTAYLGRRRRALEHKVDERTAELQALSLALQQKTAALEESSLSDPLTGLRNRRFLAQHIEADVAQSLRQHEQGAPDADLIFFLADVDHFKSVNDEHGHAAGDAVLIQMHERLKAVFREADYLVRWGGEEFLIVARATSRVHAAELAERAREQVAGQPFRLDDGREIWRSCSVGFACFPLAPAEPRALDWSATIDLADAALYAAKRAGRNRWVGVLGAQPGLALAQLHERGRRPTEWLDSGELSLLRGPAEA